MKIGLHEVRGEIGRGGMGVVYRATDPTGRDVAIKVLSRQGGDRLQRFDRERRLLEELGEDAGFVPLLDAGTSNGVPYIVMPLVPGGTLRDRLARGPLTVEDAVSLVRTLALVLGRAHARGIVHRDVKPENVIFTADGRPLVLDLGLAKHFHRDAATSVSFSRTGEALGTFAYMAPEQSSDARHVDARADVFSLGAVLYECLAGEPPFVGDSVVEMVANVHAGKFVPVENRRPAVPPWLAGVVDRALSVSPAKRYQDGAAFAGALAETETETETPPPSRRRFLPAVLAVGAIATGGVAFALRPRPAPVLLVPPSPRAAPPRPPRPLYEGATMRSTALWGTYAGRHAAMVEKVRFSPDGTLVASSGIDQVAHIWNASDLSERVTLVGHENYVVGIAFTPDGKRIVTGSFDGTARIWEVATGRVLHVLEGHMSNVNLVAVSPDGTRVLSCSDDKRLGYWDLATGALVRWIEAPAMTGIPAFLPGGKTALATCGDRTTLVFDLEEGVVVRSFDPQPEAITFLDVTKDGKWAVTGSYGQNAYLWDVATGKLLRAFGGHGHEVGSASFSPDGTRVVTGSRDEKVRIFSAATGELERTIEPGSQWILSASFSPDGKKIATGSNDGSVRLWDAVTGEELAAQPGPRGPIVALALAEDGRRAVTAGFDRTVRLWDAATGRELGTACQTTLPVEAIALSPDGRWALAGGGMDQKDAVAGEVVLCDLEAGSSRVLGGPTVPVRAIAFGPDGRSALSAAWANATGKGEIFLWKGEGGALAATKHGEVGAFAGAMGEGGAGFLGTARGLELWDLERGTLRAAGGIGEPVLALGLRGSRVVAGGQSGAMFHVELPDGPARSIGSHSKPACSIALSPDGKRAVSASYDGTVRLWSLEEDRELDRVDLSTRGDLATAVAFGPDGGSFLVSTRRGVVLRFEIVR